MKVILDCNVLISAGLKDGKCRKVLFEAIGNHSIFVSSEIIAEYKRVIVRSKFQKDQELLELYCNGLIKAATFTSSQLCPIKLLDPKDEMYLACALAAEANAVVTGNIKHFLQKQYSGVQIITPNQFIQMTENPWLLTNT